MKCIIFDSSTLQYPQVAYIYMHMCVCVCVCVCSLQLHKKRNVRASLCNFKLIYNNRVTDLQIICTQSAL